MNLPSMTDARTTKAVARTPKAGNYVQQADDLLNMAGDYVVLPGMKNRNTGMDV